MRTLASRKSCFLIAAGALSALPSIRAGAETDTTVSGKFLSNIYAPVNAGSSTVSSDTLRQSDTEAWVSVTGRASEKVSAKATFVGRSLYRPIDGITNSFPAEFILREAYGRASGKALEFQMGRILIPWGKADVINPTDYFSGKDYRVFSPDEETRRIGTTGAVVTYNPKGVSPVALTAVVSPLFGASRLLIPPSVLPAGVSVAQPQDPTISLAKMEAAGKLNLTGKNWDGSLSVFSGWNHLADLGMPSVSGPQISFNPAFHRVSAFGGDFSASFGSWIFRGEAAYRLTENNSSNSAWISPPTLDAVLGIEHPFGDHFRLQLQGIYRYIDGFQPLSHYFPVIDPVTQQSAAANALLQGYQFSALPGATGRLTYTTADESWEFEIFMIGYMPIPGTLSFSGESEGLDYLVIPKITHEFVTGLKGLIGLNYYDGPKGRPLAANATYRSVYLEVQYVF